MSIKMVPTTLDDSMATRHSRSSLAGYDPATLFAATITVVGEGALGQNVVLDLALSGAGTLQLVDFDAFEDHNLTRSPLFPTAVEQEQWGLDKAKVVAHKVWPLMSAPNPRVGYAVAPIQPIADAVIAASDIVIAAVDNPTARAFLADRCRLLGKPMVEAGFRGHELDVALYGPDPDEACYRCGNPAQAGAFSCRQYALQADAAGIIPAIQNGAAVLAGLQAELAIQWLHGASQMTSRRTFVDMRRMSMRNGALPRVRSCHGAHRRSHTPPIAIAVSADHPVAALLDSVRALAGPAEVRLPDPLVIRNYCVACGDLCQVGAPSWRWLMAPRCVACGGPFESAPAHLSPSSADIVHTELSFELADAACSEVGFGPASLVEVAPEAGDEWMHVTMAGSVEDVLTLLPASSGEVNLQAG